MCRSLSLSLSHCDVYCLSFPRARNEHFLLLLHISPDQKKEEEEEKKNKTKKQGGASNKIEKKYGYKKGQKEK